MDKADQHFADLKAQGLFVMFGAVSGSVPLEAAEQDGSFISGGDDWTQWKSAMAVGGNRPLRQYVFVDDRLQKLKLQHAKNLLTHLNPYTGKTYGEEENIAIYEVYNENGFVFRFLSGSLDKWNPYFKAKLQKQWNDWLLAKYSSDDGLTKAWEKLDANESLTQGSVQPAPDFDNRGKYPEARADDFVTSSSTWKISGTRNFVLTAARWPRRASEVNVVPFSFDTMYRPSLQWAYDESRGERVFRWHVLLGPQEHAR